MAKPEVVELARKAKKGDKKAFEDLCTAKLRDITFAALLKVGNQQDAEDVAQETVIAMYRFISKLKSPDAIDAWISSIVRSQSMDLLKKRAPQKLEQDIDDESIEVPEDDDRDFIPEAYVEDEALRSKLMEAVMQLPERAREVITLYYYEGLSYKEIAEVTGTKMATVSTNLIHARNKLKKKLMSEKMNIENSVKMAGMPAAASTVLGRALHEEALAVLPDAKMELLEKKIIASVHATPIPNGVTKTATLAKGVIAVVAGTSVVLGSVFLAGGFDEKPTATEPPAVSVPADPAPEAVQEILFTDGDCDCGHINPKGFFVSGIPDEASDIIFSVLNAEDDTVLASGDKENASLEVARLSSGKIDGSYILACTYRNSKKKEVSLKRSFVVGDYSGDVDSSSADTTVNQEQN